ncbi:glycine betaine ABC transporter substrate-binding protein, partial [Pantoea sp. ANP04]|uniref:glycine betaine ABC transporter substrate-binding protein n=1 Tax=Pantoea sp. ANP04 TaxID=3064896 RepID=UPI0035C649B0
DPAGLKLSYSWSISPSVAFDAAGTLMKFVAPKAEQDVTYNVNLTVNNGKHSATRTHQVKVLAEPSLKDARATLAVPSYLADKGLKTFADIARFQKELGGKIYGIEPGSGANTQIKDMIAKNQFGLGKFQLVESSEAGMLSTVARAVKRNEAIVFFGWAPHPMNVNFKMTYLSGSQDALGPNEGQATVWTVTAPNYAEQ